MRKGIKILGKVLSAFVLLLIILPLTLSLLLDITAVQNFAVKKAAQIVSRSLETTVSIDRVDIGLFNKLKLKGFYVEDYQRDTLLYVDRLDAFVTGVGIFGGGVVLSRGEITGAKLYLRETPEGEMNIKQVVNRISDPDRPKKGNFHLTLKKASIENMDLCLERLEHRDPEYGIDFGHMHLYGINAYVDDLTIDGQNVYTTIQTLTARERSGFVLDDFAGRFFLTSGCLGFEETTIMTARSNIHIPYISLVSSDWADYKDFIGEVRIEGSLRNTMFSTDDVAYFAPKLRDWHTDFSNVNVELAGLVSDFTGKVRSMQIGEGTSLIADVSIKGLPDIEKTRFDLTVPQLKSSADAVDELAAAIGKLELPDNLVRILGNSGEIDINARFQGLLSAFDMKADAVTDVGNIACNLLVEPLGEGRRSIKGDVATYELKLGELLGRRDLLGNASLAAYVDGTIGQGTTDANIVGSVTRLGVNNYIYDSIRLDGRLRNRQFDGGITAHDPNLDFDFSGMVDFNDSIPRYDFTMDLRHADLAQLHVNRRDSVSQLTARIVANASGRSLDDMNGSIHVTDARYRYNDKEVTSKTMTVKGENSAHSKLVELRSDFADATFRSRTSYREVFEYLRQSALRYLPVLSNHENPQAERARKAAVANDFSLLSVNIRHIDPIADAISAGLQIADGSSLQLLFNPASDQLSLKANSEYIEQKRMLATRLNVNASNRGDSLTVYASAEDLYAGVLHLPRLSLMGGAKQGLIQVSAGFSDSVRQASGLLGVRAAVVDNAGPHGRLVDVRILPSHITRGDKTWQIFANKIQIDTARVVIDRFYVMNKEQDLFVTGIASRHREDSVTLRLRNFDLAPFSQVADRLGYVVEGRTNGSAMMKSVLQGGEVTADIMLDSLEVNDIPAPPMRLTSRWDFARNRASVRVINREKRDTLIRGFYVPSDVRYYARLNVDSLDMGLLDPILTGVISDTRGLASADMVFQGQRREADLTGEVRVKGLSTKVDFTQVAYSMPEAVLNVKGNRFRAANVPVFDAEGNRGRFDIDLSLQHLSNIAYDIRVAPQQMMVLNTSSRDNDLFFGKVYATGNARIAGDKGNVKMDIVATTDDNSSFFMPLSSKSNLSYADFVTFKQVEKADTTDDLARRKRLFERQRKKQTTTGNQMNISLGLNVRPNVEVELSVSGNTLKGRGDGTLNLEINPRSNVFEMYGDYTITDGSFMFTLQNIINKKFLIENGSTIQWTGSPMDAMLDIDAVYKLKASLQPLLQSTTDNMGADRSVPVECVIHLGERLSNPEITFDVRVPSTDPEMQAVIANALATPETVDTQFAYLLLFNSFMAESASNNMGASVSAATGFEFISNMVSNLLSNDDYNIVIRYRPKSELTSDEVDFGLSRSLINNRLLVEVEGNYVIDNKQAVNNSMSNFMGEAYITYLIDRGGALRLKAFTQTIDRFDENQGLQETGVGIYFKEDFDNFKDLRRRVKERFTNKKRQARKQAKREEKLRRQQAADTLSAPAPVMEEKQAENLKQ
ncbi:translocation/assembly module TamB domain-containing protein [uncultured Alistipes sp.]|jgi:hypothetical protein|uniref:translocation/assembly module TamB domain-containing protein n=1 Tax=uncultured Alistipes sp. TaxID=538949 RepID=UPI0025FDD79C|nr:translocation/assembly module TamB domain-containing protein [uncultured Alistipes sp.]